MTFKRILMVCMVIAMAAPVIAATPKPASPMTVNGILLGMTLDEAMTLLRDDLYDITVYNKTYRAAPERPLRSVVRARKDGDEIIVRTALSPSHEQVAYIYRARDYRVLKQQPQLQALEDRLEDLAKGKPAYVQVLGPGVKTLGFRWNKKGKIKKNPLGFLDKMTATPAMPQCTQVTDFAQQLRFPAQDFKAVRPDPSRGIGQIVAKSGNFFSACYAEMVIAVSFDTFSGEVTNYVQVFMDHSSIVKADRERRKWLSDEAIRTKAKIKAEAADPDL